MALTDLVPWGRNRAVSNPRVGSDESGDPFLALHREVNRMFDDFARGFGLTPPSTFTRAWPSVEVSENDKEMTVVAELPGLDQKDIDVSLNEGVLVLRGEKKSETNGAVYSERWHGRFERAISVGADVDPEKVDASFKNGVLTVVLPKRPEAQAHAKRIQVKAA